MLIVDKYFHKKAPEMVPSGFSWKELWQKFVKGPKADGYDRERSDSDRDFLAYKQELFRQRKGRK